MLNVREIEIRDIELIADYWLFSDAEFLIGMGVDLEKIPNRKDLRAMLERQINSMLEEKQSYAIIWECNGEQIGHSNVNEIEFGNQATMHLHLWNPEKRKKGMGAQLLLQTLPYYFDRLQLETLWCQPYVLNPAPNKTLQKVGFEFVKKYRTIPGSLNFEQEVNLWKMTKTKFQSFD